MVVTIDGIPVFQALVNDAETGMFKISLVDAPAVEKDFVAFDKARKPMMYAVEDEAKRLVLGVVMRADFPIYRRDESFGEYYIIYKADTIRQMAEKYLVEGRQNDVNIMHQENSDVEGVDMVQYFIKDTEKGIAPAGFEDCADGTLFAEFHVVNDEVWDAIQAGSYKGFSLEGVFDLVPEQDADAVQEIVDALDGIFKRIFKPKNNEKMSKVKGLLARLARALVEMGNVTTDKGVLAWDGDADLKAGDAVFIEDAEGNRTPAEDGDYTTGDGKVIVVVGGKVAEIKDAKAEVAPAEPAAAAEENHIDTDKGTLVYEGDLAVGTPVNIVGEGGETTPAPDGEYTAPDGSVIVVAEGKVSEIKPAEPAAPAEPEVNTLMQKMQKIAEAFQETYNDKMAALVKAIEELGFSWPWLVEAGDEFVIAEIYNEEGPIYYRFNIKEWNEDGVPVLENGVKVVPAFVTPEEKEAAEENFNAVTREKEELAAQVADLNAQIEQLRNAPAATPAHEEFTGGPEQKVSTGNKGLDRLARIARAK